MANFNNGKRGGNSDMLKIGALWKRTSKAGNVYLGGNLDEDTLERITADQAYFINVFVNDYKEGDNDPDYKVFLSPNTKPRTQTRTQARPEKTDDIPF